MKSGDFISRLFLALAIGVLCQAGVQAAKPSAASDEHPQPARAALATINLYNPTGWAGASTVEVPIGSLGSPGLIDWSQVRLMSGDREIPFAIREGRAHWKASLKSPIRSPRAEDLLVFTTQVPSNQWLKVDVISGRPTAKDHLVRKDGVIAVSYPGLMVAINETSGMLARVEAAGENLLGAPLSFQALALEQPGVVLTGAVGPALTNQPVITLKIAKELGAPKARLVSSTSSPAMTELHFVLESNQAPAMGLTYRIYAEGLIEIMADERPWTGNSPWGDRAMRIKFSLNGEIEDLPALQTHYPFYGFKDYHAADKLIGALHRGTKTGVLELGEEVVNGRNWSRRLYLFSREKDNSNEKELIELATKGLIVDVAPLRTMLSTNRPKLSAPDNARVIAATLAKSLEATSVTAKAIAGLGEIEFKLAKDPAAEGIEGDGFKITPPPPQPGGRSILITAGTRFGLMTAACRIAEYWSKNPGTQAIPLVAANPAVNLRAAGPGGGPHEVDFPYGDDAEWEGVMDRLIASGMNTVACMGMWSDWKMPTRFKYMPELYSEAPDAYDEVSGARMADTAKLRERGIKHLNYLHERGAKVWLWIPIGCVPTTFAKKYPEAMVPGNTKVPQFMHPKYRQYLDAYFKELLETYPVDGFIMIRDDNGGVDESPQYKDYVAQSRTKNPVWEQYLIMYDMFRKLGYKGELAVYPYMDPYMPDLDAKLPQDLIIAGHGSGVALFSRRYEQLAPMGDTWLDNPYTSFRLPPTVRMKRLLSTRSSFWLGGTYFGTELPWEAIGAFGWQPDLAVNTYRYQWGARTFGKAGAIAFVRFNDAYEELWDIMARPMLPYNWILKLKPEERARVAADGRAWLKRYQETLAALKNTAMTSTTKRWLDQVSLYGTFFEYTLKRDELLAQLIAVVTPHRKAIEAGQPLPEGVRREVTEIFRETYKASEPFRNQVKALPGALMRFTEPMTPPFKEYLGGFNQWLELCLDFKQFAGSMDVSPVELQKGQPFTLKVELTNKGVCPWIPQVGHRLKLEGDIKSLGLAAMTDFASGEWILPGEKKTFLLQGTTPGQPGSSQIKIGFTTAFLDANVFIEKSVRIDWK